MQPQNNVVWVTRGNVRRRMVVATCPICGAVSLRRPDKVKDGKCRGCVRITTQRRKCPCCGGSKGFYSNTCQKCRVELHPAKPRPAPRPPATTPDAGRHRARRLYTQLGPCERCQNPATDRHHIDGNTFNNEPENVQSLCRRCHMEVDGRLAILTTVYAGTPKTEPKPCVECARLYKPLRRGLCSWCYDRKRRPRKA